MLMSKKQPFCFIPWCQHLSEIPGCEEELAQINTFMTSFEHDCTLIDGDPENVSEKSTIIDAKCQCFFVGIRDV